MIRFIDLGKQIGLDEEWPQQFAFFNTVTDTFISFSSEQVFDSWTDFLQSCTPADIASGLAERCKGLCPEWVFK